MKKRLVYGCLGLFYALTGLCAPADVQVWTNITAIGPLNPDYQPLRIWMELQERVGDDVSRLSQSLARVGLGYLVNNDTSLWLGYAFIYTTEPYSPFPFNENRIWQQYLWITQSPKFKFLCRSRLEQRFFEHVSEVAWRFRQLAKVDIPFAKASSWGLLISDEFFLNLNNFNNIENQGPDQNRFFAGVRYNFTPGLIGEVGYLRQDLNQVDQPNFRGNMLSLNLYWNF